jgi:hypothetical protein
MGMQKKLRRGPDHPPDRQRSGDTDTDHRFDQPQLDLGQIGFRSDIREIEILRQPRHTARVIASACSSVNPDALRSFTSS